jgi:AAHS family 4-hydroxybenzoate transporter-like MFS transporter
MADSALESRGATEVDIARLLDAGEWTGYQRRLVLLAALAIVFDGADIQLLGIALPSILREWQLTRADFALTFALGLVGMMVGAVVAGTLGDRIGRRVALIGSVVVFGAATMLIALVNGLAGLGALRFVAGLGLGGALPNAAALVSEYVPRRQRPIAVTLAIVCVPIGGTLAGLVAIRLLPALGWRTFFVLGGVAPLVVALLLWGLLPESPRYLARHRARWPELDRLLRRMGHRPPAPASYVDSVERSSARASVTALLAPELRSDTLALWATYFSCLLAVYLGFNWLPSMLTGAGLSPTVGSTGITAFNLGGVIGAIGGALLFAAIGSRVTMLAMAAGAAGGALVLSRMSISAASDPMPIIAMLGLTGGLINAVQTTAYALAAQAYPLTLRATGVGSASSIGRAGAILSTFAGAWALETGGSALFFVLVAAAMTVTFISLSLVRRHVRKS